ncbi:MAG: hypothetical protein JWP01_339 [Myxococcales bacterium]|nr:hypothetical protein [Myxococcales bacterium]
MAVENPGAIDITTLDRATQTHWLWIIAWRSWRSAKHTTELLTKLKAYGDAIVDGVIEQVFPHYRAAKPAIRIDCTKAPPLAVIEAVAQAVRGAGYEVTNWHEQTQLWSALPAASTPTAAKPSAAAKAKPKQETKGTAKLKVKAASARSKPSARR